MVKRPDMHSGSLPGGPVSARGMALIAVLLVLAASVGLRAWNLKSPLTEAHPFRQTQTAYTSAVFVAEGISWLHPKLPVFGPPWEVPFEFPLYQATAAVVARVTGFNVDLACRATSLAYFYLSAAMLYLLCRELFGSRNVCAAVIVVYLFSPFNVLWSRAALMEYAAVSFALGFVYCALRWSRSPGQWWWLALYVLAGSLGALTKITTMAITVPPILAIMYCGLSNGWEPARDGAVPRPGRRSMLAAVGLGVGALACMAVGQMWVSHADAIKAGSPATKWLTSSALATWNYGTLAQRCSVAFWQTMANRVCGLMVPYLCAGLPLVGLALLGREQRQARLVGASLFLAPLAPMLLFSNLYLVHDYYLCAISPMLALATGYGVAGLLAMAGRVARAPIIAAALVSALLGYTYCARAFTLSYSSEPVCVLGEAIRQTTNPDDAIIVVDPGDWNPALLYYAQRRGLMLYSQTPDGLPVAEGDLAKLATLDDPQLDVVLLAKPHPELMGRWAQRQLLFELGGMKMYRVGTAKALMGR